MARQALMEALYNGQVLVSDGGLGTSLIQRGLALGTCPDLWCLQQPDAVLAVAQGFADAGANMITTNSFSSNAIRLAHYGLSDKVEELNTAAVALARRAAGDARWVLGDMGPTGKMLITEEVTEDEVYTAYRHQALALANAGADAICIETMSDVEEACIAIRAAKENTGLPVFCTFTFDKTLQGSYRSMMGLSPTDAALAAQQVGAQVSGSNCGQGIAQLAEIIAEMHAAIDLPLLAQANAGLPVANDHGQFIYPETPKETAAAVPRLVKAGARIIGGCCGTTPAHIAAIRQVADNLRQ